jgi:uncharacterized protein YbcC (UPF0753/DUF2309 family)
MSVAETIPVNFPKSDPLATVRTVCALIPPLFDLENFVAVNPFLGWSDTPLVQASVQLATGLDAEVLPALDFYRRAWDTGAVNSEGVARAALRHGLTPEEVLKVLKDPESEKPPTGRVVQLHSERALINRGIDVPKMVRRFVSRTLAGLYSQGPIAPRIRGNQIYQELVSRAAIDKTFEIAGVSGWNQWMRSAPDDYLEAINWSASKQSDGSCLSEAYAYRLLGSQYGWASYLRGLGWNTGADELDLVQALCAALQVLDVAIAELLPEQPPLQKDPSLKPEPALGENLSQQIDLAGQIKEQLVRLCLQEAYEDQIVESQLSTLIKQTSQPPHLRPGIRPDFQLLFCIDVRSEPIRRNLEAQSPSVETAGFAGFFGIGVNLVTADQPSPRCPALLHPVIELKANETQLLDSFEPALRGTFSSPGSFNLVETLGIGYIGTLLSKATGLLKRSRPDESLIATRRYSENHFGLTLAERVGLAESILTNSGIKNRLGQVVVLCGHGGRTTNNAHAASLDCGACGGHCGALNAQMAVELLSDPAVRTELEKRGYPGVTDALFLAGQHDTSTDEVFLFLPHALSQNQHRRVKELQAMLTEASAASRKERSPAMGIAGKAGKDLLAAFDQKANDWSEVRPEWGLARNASFIAARRYRTREANLEGRAFLHEYDASADPSDEILKLILSAPVVVGAWINLQYFASTVNNDRFGCGTKALLNRVGKVGVISGNEGDLRPGLPIESVHRPDGSWFHEPVRLQVMIEAPTEKIDTVLSQIPSVADLVRNGWVRLFALDPESDAVRLKEMNGEWAMFHGASVQA